MNAAWATDEPVRAELFSAERLEQHGESLAAAQSVSPKQRAGRPLAKRLDENSQVLLAAYRTMADATGDDDPITPAAEWLVDNFHIIAAQINEIKDDLPPAYYRELPKLADGPFEGFPRVFGLAWAFVAHTDSRFDAEMLCRFVQAYQRVQPLTIGELWAIAITLRIVLVENLRRLAEQIVARRSARRDADILATHLLGVDTVETETAEKALGHLNHVKLPQAFAVQLVQRLRDQDPKVTPALLWLDRRLKAQGTSADEIVREEHQSQGEDNVTVRNIITSMRLISAVNWRNLFEQFSLVDATLRAGSDFAAMDFPSRDLYRRAIEELARGSDNSELEIAQRVLSACAAMEGNLQKADPGYYLIANGRRSFEKELGFRLPVTKWLGRANAIAGISGYLGVITLATALLVALVLRWGTESAGVWVLTGLAFIVMIPASDLVIALVNCFASNRFGATTLPGLALRDGVPPDLRTIIVVPTLLTTPAAIAEQIEHLEVHYLASPDGDLHFALLSDWTDSATESAPGDNDLLDAAYAGVADLNRRYGPAPHGQRFLLLHRRRLWNPAQGKWIGWERKRGKLHELNRWLRGSTDTTFLTDEAHTPFISGVRYVVTLDGDTRLPRAAARRLVGKMAHPLNRPVLDAHGQRVVEGHAILQPRVTPSLPIGREGSLYQRVFSSASGLDPYAFAVSDVYQDLFGEGSYSGKGIYDVDFFEAALKDRIPENTLLSHDLFEGIFARAGLVSDIEVVEEFPSRYDIAAARQHRWARGDWQLLPWLIGRGRYSNGKALAADIPIIGYWKMIDNLRRSLSAPLLVVALLCGWALPFVSASVFTGFVVATIALPALLPFILGFVPRPGRVSAHHHVRAVGGDLQLAAMQIILVITFLAHQAWLMGDAVLRTLFRLGFSHRFLLEWVTAAQAKIGVRLNIGGFYRQMVGSLVIAVAAMALLAVDKPGAWLIAAPFLALWILSPAVARWTSQPPAPADLGLISTAQAQSLRLVARRTWQFFATFVTAEDHMLPPDNFQEEPKAVLAHRTSPTNIGMYLLSVIAARDFGWIGTLETVERLEATFATLNDLESFRGHFYNWYDTRDLRPLDPKYISSVDSGNLAGHLIALSNACRGMSGERAIAVNWTTGIADSLALARDALHDLVDIDGRPTKAQKDLGQTFDILSAALKPISATPIDVARQLADLKTAVDKATTYARTVVIERGDAADLLCWVEAVGSCILSHQRDLQVLFPWIDKTPSEGDTTLAGASMPNLHDVPDRCEDSAVAIKIRRADGVKSPTETAGVDALIEALETSARAADMLMRRIATISDRAQTMFTATEFGFLLDKERQLLSIGYRLDDGTLDPSCYDLLASEARLASFIAIAKGDVPGRHWFRLGRSLAPVDRGSALISWSGSMFEYLMPSLVMRAPTGSVLEQTARLIVRRQIQYGAELGIPWGISESAFNARDLEFTYQYSNFGIPGLGLKRGLGENAVIRSVCDGSCGNDRSGCRSEEFRPAEKRGRPWTVWLVRVLGLHQGSSA